MSTTLLLDIAGLLEYLKHHVAMSDITGDQAPELRDPDEEVTAMYERVLAALQATPPAIPKCAQCQTPNSCSSDGKCLEEYIAARLKQPPPTALELMREYSNGKQWALENSAVALMTEYSNGKAWALEQATAQPERAVLAAAKGGV